MHAFDIAVRFVAFPIVGTVAALRLRVELKKLWNEMMEGGQSWRL